MAQFSDPRFEHMRRYTPRQRPYVQVTTTDQGKFHAQVIGWIPGQVFIHYPVKILNRSTTGKLETAWIPTSAAVCVRRADSIWQDPEDDHPWHDEQDTKITYRADPWTVYTQELPGE